MAYGAFETRDGEVVICTEHCARNMAYQDLTPEFGVYTKLMDLTGMVCG
jgi:leucyl-tRNA synthetase